MKRWLSSLLCLTLVCGATPVLGSAHLFAEGADYEAELWSPVEIKLTSTVSYDNAYTDAELDAVFTHEDGTVIKTPGFWDGGQNWAVRFSPTKTGVWTYTTTCSNAEDTGLMTSGTVKAVPSAGSTDTAKHGFVRLSDNKRYFVYDDGTPFFWLGDTNWQAPECVAWDESNYPYNENGSMLKEEVDNRVAKGFTVYQTYFSCKGGEQGLKSYWVTTGRKIRPDVFRSRVDKMFEYIHNSGMVIALGFGLHSGTPNLLKEDQLLRFVRYCMARYSCYNIVWITGQEITDTKDSLTKGKTCMDVWMDTAELTAELDGYHHPQGAHMYPMTMTDARALRLYSADWHNVWILQGGHGGKTQPKSFYRSYYVLPNVKPVIEGEANYEEINCGGFTGYNAPRYCAWKSIMCGCAGFTYGVSGIWASCYSTTRRTGWFNGKGGSYSYEPWYMGLNKPGSYEVMYMKNFFETLPDWTTLVPRFNDTHYASFAADDDKLVSSSEDGKTFVCYFFNGDQSTGTLLKLAAGQTYTAMWYNPLTGKFLPADVSVNGTIAQLPQKPDKADWALVVTCEQMRKSIKTEKPYEDLSSRGSAVTGSAVTPAKVTAIGGISYNNKQVMVDLTANLYDNDASTLWRPFADRVSQTILYDLGDAHKLTHIIIAPAEKTTLPRYRIEGSNDGKDWTIIVNRTDLPAVKDGNNVSEPLAGDFRYVKVLLLVADDITEAEAKASNLEYYYNEYTKSYYYRTAITGITVYSDGVSDIRPADTDTADDAGSKAAKSNTVPVVVMAVAAVAAVAGVAVYALKPKKKP
ncbi:MAG: DUF4038 domain-containing protein [Clostridia bacterium]|nr:DUF4038 domain-containing protein [Clostridia bacterium]